MEGREVIGRGYDLTSDLKLKNCKKQRIIVADDGIKLGKGERLRFTSDVLSFQQMTELFNQDLSLSGKIPSGHFNAAFEFKRVWQKDAAETKTLAFDGIFIALHNIALEKSQLVLCSHVKQEVPSIWEPLALARFIEKYGTHIVVGVKMGGKDVIYVKQHPSSLLQSADLQKKLKEVADKAFSDDDYIPNTTNFDKFSEREKYVSGHGLTLMDQFPSISFSNPEEISFIRKRRGGANNRRLPHSEWCKTVQNEPDVISMSLVPITSLWSGINGSGFLTHAINLYLRYKPPIEELHQFLEFQLPRQWAPVFGELAVGPDKKPLNNATLSLSFMGPKLYVNIAPVDVGKKPVTGLRIYLEGKRSNSLAIHLQHLSSLPKTLQLEDECNVNMLDPTCDRGYYEKIQWKSFSHVCTAPVESDDDLSIVTGARFEVGDSGMKKILFLRLRFSKVIGSITVRRTEWDESHASGKKSGIISMISTRLSTTQKPTPNQPEVNINSALYPGGPPVPTQAPKLLKFVDTTEMTRGPQDSPGYWVVSGAKLNVDKGKISLRVKYSLLTLVLPDEELIMI